MVRVYKDETLESALRSYMYFKVFKLDIILSHTIILSSTA